MISVVQQKPHLPHLRWGGKKLNNQFGYSFFTYYSVGLENLKLIITINENIAKFELFNTNFCHTLEYIDDIGGTTKITFISDEMRCRRNWLVSLKIHHLHTIILDLREFSTIFEIPTMTMGIFDWVLWEKNHIELLIPIIPSKTHANKPYTKDLQYTFHRVLWRWSNS